MAKRITYWPQAVLGLAFNWGALLGYAAVVGHCDWSIALPLYSAGVSWTLVYDTIYAHQVMLKQLSIHHSNTLKDKDDDRLIGVKSTALKFGENTKTWLSMFSTLTVASLTACGINAGLSWPYFAGVSLGAAHFVWQLKTVDLNNREQCWKAFDSNKYFGALIFGGILGSKFIGI